MSSIQEQIWGKYSKNYGFYPLLAHLYDTAVCAEIVFDYWLRPGLQEILKNDFGESVLQVVSLVAGLHDLGKGNPVFQGQQAAYETNKDLPVIREHFNQFANTEYFIDVKRREANRPSVRRHEQVGALDLFGDESKLFKDRVTEHWLAAVVAGHHGTFFRETKSDDERQIDSTKLLRSGVWKTVREDSTSLIERFCGLHIADLPRVISPISLMLLTGLVTVADRLSSGDDWVAEQAAALKSGSISLDNPDEWKSYIFQKMLNRVKLLLGIFEPLSNAQETLLGCWNPRPAQKIAQNSGDGMLTIMSATGSGKTEAALLRHANASERLIFLLPTQATTNAMMRRLQEAFQNTSNVGTLAHGMAILENFYSQKITVTEHRDDSTDTGDVSARGLYPTEFVRQKSARLLAPVVVATVDQAVMASLPMKWTALRLLALANSHVVMDEVHTLSPYQTRLIEPLMTWLGRTGTRVTLLSATMPHEHLEQLTNAYTGNLSHENTTRIEEYDFPATASVSVGGKVKVSALKIDINRDQYQINYDLKEVSNISEAHIDWAKQIHEKYPKARLGVFVNTIDRAQEIAGGLLKLGCNVMVLHSRLTAKHRSEVEEALFNALGPRGNAEGLVVVGTQAIEASLDIDLDLISTDLAPAPSLLQRFGRAWRRQDTKREQRIPGMSAMQVQIVAGMLIDENAGYQEKWWIPYLYSPLRRTCKWLRGHRGAIVAPNDIQSFVEQSWVSAEELEDAEDFDEYASILQEQQKATQWINSWPMFYRGEARMDALRHLTWQDGENAEGESPRTRSIERENRQLIILGEGSDAPGAFNGTVEELRSLRVDRNGMPSSRIKEALRAQINVSSAKMIKVLREKVEQYPVLGEETTPLLRGRQVVRLGDDFTYDTLFGLQLLRNRTLGKAMS
ncbi:CRISPR-associated helicase/endonuclease Cas3 [Mobiluncus mulieris]|uniref:CRISPR-associated helicase/endonuclease Cas3 n=1 Tax=Mobiluncus mulieris TaxID=2052 RepID=UPI00019F84E2|nr:CRISPR-associated helicase/endonuclease Cas3 [Mobiluncus mulieris]EEJ54451.1 CRISPR-associated helicase Cas3 [Mobiluncus mulieris ATCC 35243]MCV0001445.1 CRISPR-associated helicase/endonuclease Cas3 [Mobiluncus mulieris]SPX76220.1 helicase Cas3 [Mobiluncus mulieris]